MKDANIPPTKHEINQIEAYQAKGYTASYQLKDGKLCDLETNKLYNVEDVNIDEEYRYEGMSNPSDLSILYILSMDDGSKGTLLLPYGPSGDGALGWFMKEVSLREKNSDSD